MRTAFFFIVASLVFPMIPGVFLYCFLRKKNVIQCSIVYASALVANNLAVAIITMLTKNYSLEDLWMSALYRPEFLLKWGFTSLVLSFLTAVVILHFRLKFRRQESSLSLKGRHTRRWAVFFVFLAFFFALGLRWLMNNFGVVKPDALVFHMQMPLDSAVVSRLVTSFLFECILLSVTCTAIFSFFLLPGHARKYRLSLALGRFYDRCAHPGPIWEIEIKGIRSALMVSAALCIISFGFFAWKSEIKNFLVPAQKSEFIAEHYVDPSSVRLQFPEKKRNLVFIFLESMETSFSSQETGGAFTENYIPHLTELAQDEDNVHFSNSQKPLGGALQVTGTQWTIAGMVAQMAGLPLKLPIQNNDYGRYSTFLPGITSLGDILSEQEYNQTVMFGSDAGFAGRDKFFEQHGAYKILDYSTAAEDGIIPHGYHVFWGFEDDYLFEYAKKEITRLAGQEKPFNFVTLTVDTHSPDGYVNKNSETKYDSQYKNAIATSDRQLAEFLTWLSKQDFFSETTVVITGDHLLMNGAFFQEIDKDYVRTTYNVIINAQAVPQKTLGRLFSTMDIFPTVLAALGVEIPENQLGLGVDLFSDTPTLIEEYGFSYVDGELGKSSEFYNEKFLFLE